MKVDDTRSISIFYLEPTDERSIILNGVDARRGQKEGIIIVLPNESTRAFRSPTNFREFLVRKHQGLSIIFVIPKQGVAQWAKANNFTVFSSLEELAKVAEGRKNHASVSPRNAAGSFYRKEDAVSLEISPNQGLQGGRDNEQYQYDTYQPYSFSMGNNPITPPPEINEGFLQQISTQFTDIPLQKGPENSYPKAASSPLPVIETQGKPDLPGKRSKQPLLIIILVIALLSAALSGFFLITQKGMSTTIAQRINLTPTVFGHVYFLSSGQIDALGTVGINDEVEVQLAHIPQPQQGKTYYVWLRSDVNMSDGPVVLLGQLDVGTQGNAHLANSNPLHLYEDPQHTDLLTSMSQFLITQEDTAMQPTVPSPDHSAWSYYGLISQTPNPQDIQNHFSLLNHLRHLLAAEPALEKVGLHGGLSLWLDRNVQKLNEYATAARDEQNPGLQHREIIRLLDYLDGVRDVSRDVPAQSNTTNANKGRVLVDTKQASIGLLQIHAYQNPASILQQIGFHLTSLVNSPGANKNQQHLADQLDIAINNVQHWLSQMRQDAQQLVTLSNDQLKQAPARVLLDDLVTQGTNALNGFTDPATNTTQNGVDWIHNTMQNLAMIDVSSYKA